MRGKIKPIDNQPSIEKVSKKKTPKGKLRKADEQLAVGKVKKKIQLKSTIFAADEPTASGKVNKKAQYKGTVIPPEDLMPSGKITKKVKFFSKLAPVIQVALGKIQVKCVNLLKAEMDKEPIFFASILADGETLEYKILDGQIIESIKQYGGSVIELNQRLIFLHAVAKFCIKCNRAMLTQAPAYTMEIDHSATIDKEAHMAQHPPYQMEIDHSASIDNEVHLRTDPADEITVDNPVKITISAKLIAYYKAQAKYVKDIHTKIHASIASVRSAILANLDDVKNRHYARLQSAKSRLFGTKKKVSISGEYKAIRADTATAKMRTSKLTVAHEASAERSVASVTSANKKIGNPSVAKLIAYVKAQTVYISNILTKHASKALAAKSALLNMFEESFYLTKEAKASRAVGVATKSENNSFVCEHETEGSAATGETFAPLAKSFVLDTIIADAKSASGQDVSIDGTFQAKATAAASAVKIQDVDIDSLTKATHSANMVAYHPPEVIGKILYLYQPFSAIQVQDVLEIDLEDNPAFWANAVVSDGIMHLLFINEEFAEKNGYRLELK